VNTLLAFARRYLLPYLHWYAGGTIALAATNWISVTIPLYLADGIDALALGEAGRDDVWRATWMVALLGVSVIGVRLVSRLLFFTPGRLVEARVREDLFERILRHQPAFLEQWPTGDLVSRLTSDVNMVRLLAGFTALGVVNTVVALSMTTTQMVRISPTLAGMVAVPLLLGFLVTLAVVGQLRAIMQELQERSADLSDHVLSSYQGIATIHAFRAEQALTEQFDVHADGWLQATLKRANLRVAIGPVLSLAAAINVFLLIYVGGPMAVRGEITVGELVAFTTLVAYLAGPLRGMTFILSLFKQAQASLDRIDALLLSDPDRPELPDAVPAPKAPPALEVRDLTFTYPAAPTPTLSDVSLSVPAGGTLGIFGPTGSGKTTLLRVLSRLYNPPPGTVFVDGVDITQLDLDAWRRVMTLVPQRAFLFSETIRDNILLGGDDDESLDEILSRAALDVDLAALPDGVLTTVGESGLTLSGGQRQRTALARGLGRDTQLLMLDDVLSAVDHHTEQQLLGSLADGERTPTTAIVANRLSAILHADVIVVLEGGRVVDQGTHAELVSRPGLYRDTWLRQSEREAS
jgi:ATP-binding cassette subfamily B protein